MFQRRQRRPWCCDATAPPLQSCRRRRSLGFSLRQGHKPCRPSRTHAALRCGNRAQTHNATDQFTLTPTAFRRTFNTPVHATGFPSAWFPELLQYDEPPEMAAAGPKSPEPRYTLEALALSKAASCSADAWDTAANTRHAMRIDGPIARTRPQQATEEKRCTQELWHAAATCKSTRGSYDARCCGPC